MLCLLVVIDNFDIHRPGRVFVDELAANSEFTAELACYLAESLFPPRN
jgi:hypothetical protein